MLSSVKTSALLRALHPRAVGLASISHSACLATRSVTKLLATPAEESPSPLRKDTSAANTLQEDRHPSKGSRKCLTLSRLGGSSEYISLPHALSPGDPLVAASPAPFLFYPAYLSPEEQRVLLQASLLKLDGNGGHSKAVRLKRKKRLAEEKARRCFRAPPHYGFLPEDMYDFQEVCSHPCPLYKRPHTEDVEYLIGPFRRCDTPVSRVSSHRLARGRHRFL